MNTTLATDPTVSLTTSHRRRVWTVGLVAGAAAAVVTEVFALGAHAAGVSMRAGNIGAATAQTIPAGSFAMGTLICTFWGTVLAVILARYATRPALTFTVAAAALTVLSFVSPIAAGATASSTKFVLCIAHLIAASIVIPALRRPLPTSRT